MNIRYLANSLSSKMPSCETMSKVGFGIMGALSPIFAGMAVKAANSGSYVQSGVFALTALTGPSLMKNIRSFGEKAYSSFSYAGDLAKQMYLVSEKAFSVTQRVKSLLPKSSRSSEPSSLDVGTLVNHVDRAISLSGSALDKAEWVAKNKVEAVIGALCAIISWRLLVGAAFLYGVMEVSKKVFNMNARQEVT